MRIRLLCLLSRNTREVMFNPSYIVARTDINYTKTDGKIKYKAN